MQKRQASTVVVAGAIAFAHVIILGGIAVVQGCGTTRGPVALPDETPMPPMLVPETPLRPDPVTPVPAHVAVSPTVPVASADTSVYVVGKGDYLSGIAKKLGVSVGEIMALNNMRDANKIRSGQRLIVPGKVDLDAVPVRPATTPQTPLPATGSVGTYVVRSGDCLSAIAQRCGVSTQDLKAANELSTDLIRVGQKLVIPAGGHAAGAPAPRREPAPPARDELPQPVMPAAPRAASSGLSDAMLPSDLAPVGNIASVGVRKHTVQANDNLLSVASQWNVSIADLKRANDIPDGPLTPGQVLTIPASD